MRVLVSASDAALVGGVEHYLGDVAPALIERGWQVAVVCDRSDRGQESWIPSSIPRSHVFVLASSSRQEALARVREWKPDLVYAHGMVDASFETDLLGIAPIVYFVHTYLGACISGTKRFARPDDEPCGHAFGPMCLLRYLPRRCGGMNPATMLRLYREQRVRQETLRRCARVLTHSFHMYSEYSRYEIPQERLAYFPYFTQDYGATGLAYGPYAERGSLEVRLAFLGRLERYKGVHLLLEAAGVVLERLQVRIGLRIVGDGPSRSELEAAAATAIARGVEVEFVGRIDSSRIPDALSDADLLVVPSVGPEPFGRVGPEAGSMGLPAAAFNVGGIGSWLTDGVNGHLAPANPPTVAGLASAIVNCLKDHDHYLALRKGAVESARRFNRADHVSRLVSVFEDVATT